MCITYILLSFLYNHSQAQSNESTAMFGDLDMQEDDQYDTTDVSLPYQSVAYANIGTTYNIIANNKDLSIVHMVNCHLFSHLSTMNLSRKKKMRTMKLLEKNPEDQWYEYLKCLKNFVSLIQLNISSLICP